MAQADADRDLLFGALALQEGLIDRPALLAALRGRSGDAPAPLADRLVAGGALDAAGVARVWALFDTLPDSGGTAPTEMTATLGPSDPAATATFGHLATEPDPAGATVTAIHLETTEPDPTRTFESGPDGAGGRMEPARESGEPGRFRVLRPFARGGLGEVSVALDGELNREVAFKQIMGRHADDPRSRARFLVEAEITGGLEHPGIVPVYGMGSDSEGRPYYAMRLVKGGTLKQAIAGFHEDPALKADPGARSLALRELLRRFGDACNAIDYAHGRGVLHRDLKPSNIIAGRHGETLVLDWGLAKATGRHDPGLAEPEEVLIPGTSGGEVQTVDGSALGTPAFMSPEAAAGDLASLGPRSDVYSLGATLYCILTGLGPFAGANLPTLLGQVRAGEFPRPRALDSAVDPALEAICLKAMSLKAADRYPSARELVGDLKRWAADEPVLAYPEGRRRRLARWVRRRAALVAGVGALLATASVTLAVAAGMIAVERDNVAQARNLLADSNGKLVVALDQSRSDVQSAAYGYRLARDAIQQQLVNVAQSDLPSIPQAEALRIKLTEDAVGLFGRLLLRDTDARTIRHQLARTEDQLAGLYRATGRYAEAAKTYEAAIGRLEPEVEGAAPTPLARQFLAHIESQYGELIRSSGGRFDRAEPHFRRAVDLAAGLARDFPKEVRYAQLEAWVNANLSYFLAAFGRPDLAEPIGRKAAERGRIYDASLPADKFTGNRMILPISLGALSLPLGRQGKPGAEPAAAELVAVLRGLDALGSDFGDVQFSLANGLDQLARVVAADPARLEEALALQDEAVARVSPLLAKYPSIVRYPGTLAELRAGRAATRIALGRLDAARADLELALPALQADVDRVKGAASLEAQARATADLARLEARQGHIDEARRRFGLAIAGHEQALAIDPQALRNVEPLARDRAELAALP